MTSKPVRATALNVSVLRDHMAGNEVAANRIESVHVSHMRRCLRAGLVTVSDDRATLALTEAGKLALASSK